MTFDTKFIRRVGHMGVMVTDAEVRFRLPGANVLVKIAHRGTMTWSMNGAGTLNASTLSEIERELRAVVKELDDRNLCCSLDRADTLV